MWFHQHDSTIDACAPCLHTAAAIMSSMDQFNEILEYRLHLKLELKIGIGIACGHAAVGIFGAPEFRIHYGVLGPPVNLASRLCAEAPAGAVLIGGEVIEHCTYESNPVGWRTIKGFEHKIEVRQINIPKFDPGPMWRELLAPNWEIVQLSKGKSPGTDCASAGVLRKP
jgi:class 3 adenylate cyclase